MIPRGAGALPSQGFRTEAEGWKRRDGSGRTEIGKEARIIAAKGGRAEVREFLARTEEIEAERPSYRIGGTARDGTCDCIGLIVGAIRRAGGSWTGLKGSNYAARKETEGLRPIRSAAELRVGEAVYKAHEPEEEGYDAAIMSSRYAASADRRDYYHIGVVASVSPLRIRHMTTPTVKTDTKLGRWEYHGRLKRVSYTEDEGEEAKEAEKADGGKDVGGKDAGGEQAGGKDAGGKDTGGEPESVRIAGGVLTAPIRLRRRASRRSAILTEMPQNSEAELLSYGDTWCRVRYGRRKGYVMTVFVHRAGEEA